VAVDVRLALKSQKEPSRILLLDDEEEVLYSIREFLLRSGYEVDSVTSGEEALELLVESAPDMIISDLLMDDMDGFEFQKRVNALTGNKIPFIFLTGSDDRKARLDGLLRGADDYIVKPFEPDELAARVQAVLNRVQQTREVERRRLQELRRQIISEISKELRAPVARLQSYLNLLLTRRFSGDEQDMASYLESALGDARVLRELIDDLSWAGAEVAEEYPVEREPVRVAPVVRTATAQAARLAAERSVELKISCGGLLSANLDAAAMEKALSGLLESAVAVSPSGTLVTISASRANEGGVEFVIRDGGCASDTKETDAVSADVVDFAARVVKGHGGQLSIDRDKQHRTSVIIWLPGRVAKYVGQHE
jgi:DNA-binding response OmpR family regulator